LRDRIRGVFGTGLLSVALAPAIHAQQDEIQPQAALSDVVVTGTRIRHIEGQAAALPIVSVAAEELNDQGETSLGDVLNDLPALRTTYSQGNSTRFIGTAGLNWLDLHGLGVERTLVLVNNRRHVTSQPGDYYVDINTIPSDLIERVDIVTGGNSAVYGSDAVAGVVNFIMRRDFDGLRMRAQSGVSSKGDRKSGYLSVTAGRNFAEGRGNVAVALEWAKTDPLYFRDRDSLTGAFSGIRQFDAAEDSAGEPGGSDGIADNAFYDGGIFDGNIADGGLVAVDASGDPGSANFCGNLPDPIRSQRCLPNNQPRIFSFDGSGNLTETVPGTDLRPFGSGNVRIGNNPGSLSSHGLTGQLAPGLERYSGNLLAHYDFSNTFRTFLEGTFVHIDAIQEGPPSFWRGSIPGFFRGGTELRCNNPFLSAQALEVLQTLGSCAIPTGTFEMNRLNVDFGGRGELHDRDTYRIVGGVEGEFNGDWHYEFAANYGHLDTRMRSLNDLVVFDLDGNEDGFLLAINAVRNAQGQIVCGVNADADTSNDRPDCVPINVFGPGAPSQAALDFVNTTTFRNESASQFIVSAYTSGDLSQLFELPAGPVGFALGAEYREEQAKSVFDELTAAGATFQNAIQPFLPPDLSVKEVFAELRVPLLRDLPMASELTLEGAGRISDYNTETGSVSAYNAGLIYAPVPEVRLRANYSKSVRVPTQGDLYRPLSQDNANIADPCDVLFIDNNPNRAANCAAAGVPVGFQNSPAREGTTGFLAGGNPLLVEEEGRSYTVDAVFTPRLLPGFAISIDYYDIEVTSLIAPPSAQAILNACYNSPSGIDNQFCATVNRKADGTFDQYALVASGFNYARQVTQGVDLDVSYGKTFGNGHRLNARLVAAKVLELVNFIDPEDPTVPDRQLSELGDPELAFNLDVGYGFGNLDLTYNIRYVGRQTIATYEEQHRVNGNPPTDADRYPRKYFPEDYVHGIRGEYAFNEKLRGFAGVDNLTDSLPPLGLVGVYAGEPYDNVGRYIYLGMIFDW